MINRPHPERLEYLRDLDPSGFSKDTTQLVIARKETTRAILTINRPSSRNALNAQTWDCLANRLLELREDPKVRAVVLEGAPDERGRQHFSAGFDISQIARLAMALEGRPAEIKQAAYDCMAVARHTLTAIKESPFAVIAKMQRGTLGIGTILALACDRRVADDTVVAGIPAGKLGIMLDPREIWILITHVGVENADEILMSGEQYRGEAARKMGLVKSIVKPEEVDPTIERFIDQVEAQSRGAIITAKAGIAAATGRPPFRDEDITLDRYYQWAEPETIRRILEFTEQPVTKSP